MSDLLGETSPIYDLKIYNETTPIILISLGSLYICIMLFRYFRWRYRKRKAKKMRIDRRKLEKFWAKRAAYLDSQEKTIQQPLKSHLQRSYECKIPYSFDSNATLVVAAGASNQLTMTPENNSQIVQTSSRHYHFKENKVKSKKRKILELVTNRVDGNYQRKKRRQLLWQWSVAMGYCRYNHGQHMNSMIDRLLESKNKDDSDNSSC
ncbi:hypothetical protein BDF21DRAFT_492704 [Thamnidium elegans]|nr:hypothetical protein BDF21DRAFT_492704 [Thamnidium elegans]